MSSNGLNRDQKPAAKLVDPFGRTVDYLRLSVTDRCNLRCTYCMAEEMTFLPKQQILTLEEMRRSGGSLCRAGDS